MRTAAQGATFFVAAWLLGGCASSPSVRQAKLNDPIIVVTVQSTPTKTKDKPAETQAHIEKAVKENEVQLGILGALSGSKPSDIDSVFGGVIGGVPGGVIGGVPGGGFGGLGAIGSGTGGGGTGSSFGLGGIGTIGRGSTYGGGFTTPPGAGAGPHTKVKLGHVIVTGALTVDVVQRQIDEHRDDIQTCHLLEYKHSGNHWGAVTLRLQIDSQGHVADVQVYESTLSSRELESCIAHTIGAFEFPSPGAKHSATVLLPVSF